MKNGENEKKNRIVVQPAAAELSDVERRRRAIAQLKVLREGQTLGMPVQDLVNEGRMRLVKRFLGTD
jgi:hypothetical protein